ncbi:amidase [Desulfosarcina ovata subsp. sediminis]|uniref:Amidase n=1 Tax=Desulfosarcina ovata subsp. sediminis TaxID=885957 RepID=A0A5K7ZWK5_9BACT|nr:amidase family protein [Desulfosarcina ovata]BBO84643.1 amidase [Desulfosarcina ovata subsp. sediminis]
MNDFSWMAAWELAQHMAGKSISPLEVMQATVDRIEQINPDLNAFAVLGIEAALNEARTMTERIAAGKPVGPLAGLPLGVKDLEDAAGLVTSYGSIPFKDNLAMADSIQVARLKAAGAIVVGKTNVPEFGFTGFTKNRLYGVTRNPWNRQRTPGGSSGGAAAAISAGLVPLCTGSDAGGSIRIPASYCGCFGIKPSFGRIPLGPSPVVSCSAMTVAGPLTRTVRDAALYLDCTAGVHPADPYALPAPTASYLATIDELPERLRIAFSPDLGYARVQREVMANVEQAVDAFKGMGHTVERWAGSLPDVGEAWSTLIATDIYAQLGDLSEEDRETIGRTLLAAVDRTRHLTVAELTIMQRLRAELNRRLETLFESFDLLLTPTMPTEAFDAGGPPPAEIDGHPIPLLGAVAFTYPFNLSGHPAATVPAGLTPAGLPVGLQIVGPRHRDDRVLQASRAYERARPWKDQRPGDLTKP